jgi:hypothetical protein
MPKLKAAARKTEPPQFRLEGPGMHKVGLEPRGWVAMVERLYFTRLRRRPGGALFLVDQARFIDRACFLLQQPLTRYIVDKIGQRLLQSRLFI